MGPKGNGGPEGVGVAVGAAATQAGVALGTWVSGGEVGGTAVSVGSAVMVAVKEGSEVGVT